MSWTELGGLVDGAVRAPEAEPPRGATDVELSSLSHRLGAELPDELRRWLSICRGAAIGPVGVYGQRPDDPALDHPGCGGGLRRYRL
jgi:hypothetical protein